jgi:hypothetical protein
VSARGVEKVDGGNWREFVQSPLAVLVLGKSDCDACRAWSEELERFLAQDHEWTQVRIGKMFLDEGRLGEFKRENPWLADVDVLPFNLVYMAGEQVRSFPGDGIERLLTRLRTVTSSPS